MNMDWVDIKLMTFFFQWNYFVRFITIQKKSIVRFEFDIKTKSSVRRSGSGSILNYGSNLVRHLNFEFHSPLTQVYRISILYNWSFIRALSKLFNITIHIAKFRIKSYKWAEPILCLLTSSNFFTDYKNLLFPNYKNYFLNLPNIYAQII